MARPAGEDRRELCRHASPGAQRRAAQAADAPLAPAHSGALGEEAARKKAGNGLDHWFAVLDAFRAGEQGHTATADYLYSVHGVPGWHALGIIVAYERARGLRYSTTGTARAVLRADTGFLTDLNHAILQVTAAPLRWPRYKAILAATSSGAILTASSTEPTPAAVIELREAARPLRQGIRRTRKYETR